jgi:PAS domain S-box-containing protein
VRIYDIATTDCLELLLIPAMTDKEPIPVNQSITAKELRQRAEAILREKGAVTQERLASMSPETVSEMIHEFQVHQIEQELLIDELRQSKPESKLLVSDNDKPARDKKSLREYAAFQKAILNSLPEHIVVLNNAGEILAVNEPWLRFARENGNPSEVGVGVGVNYLNTCKSVSNLADTCSDDLSKGLYEVLSGKKEHFSFEYSCHSPDRERWFTMEVIRLEGNVGGAIVTHTDITERKVSEDELRLANQMLRAHVAQTPMAVIEWNLKFQVTNWNRAAQDIFGFSFEEALGKHASFIVPEAFRVHVDDIWRSLIQRSGGERSSNENVRKDGATIFCEWYNTPLLDEHGTCKGVASLAMDVTERRRAEQVLIWEKNALELIVSSVSSSEVLSELLLGLEKQLPGSICVIKTLNEDGTYQNFRSGSNLLESYICEIGGDIDYITAGLSGTTINFERQVIVEDIAKDLMSNGKRELALKHGLRSCWSIPIHDGNPDIMATLVIYHPWPYRPTPAATALIERVVHVFYVAQLRKFAEDKINRLQAELEQRVKDRTSELLIVNTSLGQFKAALDEHALVSITDTAGTIIYANDKFCATSKFSRDELVGQNHRIISSGFHEKEVFRILWKTITSGKPWKGELKNRAKDGTFYWVNTTIIPFLGDNGKPNQFIAISTNITARKKAEEEIQKLNVILQNRALALEAANQELEAFSYSVSHDLRAPLRAVDGFSQMVLADYAERLDSEGKRMLGVIRSEAARMGHLIDDLLTFSRIGRLPVEPVAINMQVLVREIYDELIALEPEREIRFILHPLPSVLGSASMIRQLWINLINNALKFTANRKVGEIEIGAKDDVPDGPIYFIKDNGVGFDMRYVGKLFVVFQRLHEQKEFPGTGVGLALVHRIIQRHGGRIWAEAEPERGATFYFTLPSQLSQNLGLKIPNT